MNPSLLETPFALASTEPQCKPCTVMHPAALVFSMSLDPRDRSAATMPSMSLKASLSKPLSRTLQTVREGSTALHPILLYALMLGPPLTLNASHAQ